MTDAGRVEEKVSVVVPVFNEVRSIEEVLDDLSAIADLVPGSDFVVVDDASTDGTTDLLVARAERDPRVRLITAPRNRGHGPSLVAGIEQASHAWLFLVDADGQIDPAQFAGLWTRRADADLVMGTRTGRSDRIHRRALSRAVEMLTGRLAGRGLPDPNVPFKLVRRALWDDLRPFVSTGARTPSLLIALGAALRGWRITTVPVAHRSRPERRSKLRLGRLVGLSAGAAVELVSFARRIRRAAPREQGRQERSATPTR